MSNIDNLLIDMMNDHWHYDVCVLVLGEDADKIAKAVSAASMQQIQDWHHDARFLTEHGVNDPAVHFVQICTGMEWQSREYQEYCEEVYANMPEYPENDDTEFWE